MTELDTDADRPPLGESRAEPTDGAAPTAAATKGSHARNLLEWVAIVVAALAVALVVKTFLIQAFFIPSLSMYPTLDKGDRVLVNKLSYEVHDVHRGDIVVFERPPGRDTSNIKDLIKRVVGLSGETIEARDGSLYIEGRKLDEPYLPDGVETDDLPLQEIPENYVFVMGDNRGDSADSRVFGPIPESTIVGRAFVRVWPLSHLNLL